MWHRTDSGSRRAAQNPRSGLWNSPAAWRGGWLGRNPSRRPGWGWALLLVFALLTHPQSGLAQETMAVGLKAGETFLLVGLAADSTPKVHFSDNPNSFLLECGAPGKCSVLGTEAGHGTVSATLAGGEPIKYQIAVSAVSHPGQPLAPGAAPHPEGDIFTAHSAPVASSVAAPRVRNAPTPISAPLAAVAPSSTGGVNGPPPAGAPPALPPPALESPPVEAKVLRHAPVEKYTQNPAANALELPPTGSSVKHYLPARSIRMTGGSSRVFDFPVSLRRVAIADTNVADVTVVGPNQVMVVAHKSGATTLSVWQDDDEYFERQVRVEQGGPQQVELRAVVAELDRARLEAQGVDISVALANAGISIVGLQGAVATPYNVQTNLTASGGAGTVVALPPSGVLTPGGQLIPLLLSSNITYGFASTNGQATTNAMFQFLENHQLAKILAQPMLIAASGEQAKFLSGGEIPIVIAQALNTSIVFKQFGTAVVFVPTVVDEDEIELQVSTEYSEPNFTEGVSMFGFTVPAFVTRRAQTLVRMKESQTLIIAGLILDNLTSVVQKTPYLGDLPYLGYLFKHTSYQRNKSELVMTVTPEIIRPIPTGIRVALPTDRGPMTPAEISTRPLDHPDAARARF
jgi:pilus assembly protein CpaC